MEKLHKKYRKLWGNEAEMLVLQRRIIDAKPVLQAMYRNFYSEVRRFIPEKGLNVEIGTGHGYTKMFFEDIIQTDRVLTPHIAVCNDAQALPFKDGSLDTIMVFGVLHHMKSPDEFFKEARRALKRGGRIVMVEPYVSLLSYPIYKLVHHEGLNLGTKACESEQYHLLDANIAIPTIFFKKRRKEFEGRYPDLEIIYESYHTPFLFFASGGYIHPNLLPRPLLPVLLWLEKVLRPLGKWLGSMMTIVIRKN